MPSIKPETTAYLERRLASLARDARRIRSRLQGVEDPRFEDVGETMEAQVERLRRGVAELRRNLATGTHVAAAPAQAAESSWNAAEHLATLLTALEDLGRWLRHVAEIPPEA